MGAYRSRQHDDDDQRYDWRDWLLGVGIAVCAVALIGTCSWRLLLAVAP